MNDRSLFIALPTYGGVDALFFQSITKIIANPPCPLAIKPRCGDSLVSRSRNELTAEFLASNATHMLFIDSDLVFSGEHVARMLSHDVDVVGGLYPKKQVGPPEWVLNTLPEQTVADSNGLQEVKYIGTGFLRVSRKAIEDMIAFYGHRISYTPDHDPSAKHYDLWPVGPYEYPDGFRRYLSEDWYFCQRWLDMGGKVYADCRTILKHVGTAVYPIGDRLE